jgi:hypothetical protein
MEEGPNRCRENGAVLFRRQGTVRAEEPPVLYGPRLSEGVEPLKPFGGDEVARFLGFGQLFKPCRAAPRTVHLTALFPGTIPYKKYYNFIMLSSGRKEGVTLDCPKCVSS